MAQKGLQLPVTRQLFHGTRGDVIKNICKDGFDRSHCGKNGLFNMLFRLSLYVLTFLSLCFVSL